MTEQKSSNFGLGLVFGAVAGVLAALFLTPTSGEENRKKAKELYEELKKIIAEGKVEEAVKDLFGDVTEEGKRLYSETSVIIAKRYEELKDEYDSFDKVKFQKFVSDTVSEVGAQVKATVPQIEKLKATLIAKLEPEEKKTEKAKKVLKPKIKVEA